jgi:putative addiction module component (TIGR02574 family)
MSATEILAKARELPLEERREIAEALLDDLESQEEDLTPEQIAELDRRLAAFEKNPREGMTLEQIKAEMRQRFGWE